MGFNCGIVGLPNVGKSTLFNALTKAGIEAANYPFCTIEPNVGIVPVPDLRLDKLAEIITPQRVVPTTMEFVDIAGLIAGAAKGEGLGNKFLSHIRETDAIGHVVRCFDNEDVIHVTGKVDPIRDIEIIHTELALADLESLEKAMFKLKKQAKSGDKEATKSQAFIEKLIAALNDDIALRSLELDSEEQLLLKRFNLLTAKPVLYIANVDEEGLDSNEYVEQVKAFAAKENSAVVILCAAFESEISELEDDEKQEFLQTVGLSEPGLNRVIRAGYSLLDLVTFFTAGVKEVRAWTVRRNSTAPQSAACIHTDFEKGFIRAEVIAYDDFVANLGEQGAKEAGKWRLEGKEYITKDGDVMHFRFNV